VRPCRPVRWGIGSRGLSGPGRRPFGRVSGHHLMEPRPPCRVTYAAGPRPVRPGWGSFTSASTWAPSAMSWASAKAGVLPGLGVVLVHGRSPGRQVSTGSLALVIGEDGCRLAGGDPVAVPVGGDLHGKLAPLLQMFGLRWQRPKVPPMSEALLQAARRAVLLRSPSGRAGPGVLAARGPTCPAGQHVVRCEPGWQPVLGRRQGHGCWQVSAGLDFGADPLVDLPCCLDSGSVCLPRVVGHGTALVGLVRPSVSVH